MSSEATAYVSYNGTLHPANALPLSAGNRALCYGDALFETIRLRNGRALWLLDHLARLQHGSQALSFDLTNLPSAATLQESIAALAQQNGIAEGGRARLTIVRQEGGRYAPQVNSVDWLLECSPLQANDFNLNASGLHLDLFEKHRKPVSPLAALKSANSMIYVLAGVEKNARQLDGMLLLNDLANLCEEISSNVFLVLNGVLYTPGLSDGCLPGTMRQRVIALAEQQGMGVHECPLSPEVLFKADEVLLTNAIQGVQWVLAYRHKRYKHQTADKLVALLNQAAAAAV